MKKEKEKKECAGIDSEERDAIEDMAGLVNPLKCVEIARKMYVLLTENDVHPVEYRVIMAWVEDMVQEDTHGE